MNKLSKLFLTAGLTANMLMVSAMPAFADSYCPLGLGGAACATNVQPGGVVRTVVNIMLFVGLAAALIFLIIGGVKWIMSGGDKAQTEAAKNAVTSALIGMAVVLGSFLLINLVLSFFGVSGGISGLVPKLDVTTLGQP